MLKQWYIRYGEFIVAAALLCFCGFSIGGVYGFSIFPDEFAYWAYAAGMSGYDWSDITSLGSYYSYGYSLVLFPIFVLCKNAVTAYRAAIGLNFLFLFLAFICLERTMKKVTAGKEIPIVLFSALTILFPGNLFYTQMTMTEVFLVSLYVIVGSVLFYYLESNSLSALFLLMLTWMYLYIVHMRTVGIFISGILVLLFHILLGRGKKSHILVIVIMTVVLFAAGSVIKESILFHMYGGIHKELAAGNDYSGQIEKIRYIFTRAGFYDFVISILGKILYLGLATYGLFYWGIYALAKHIAEMLRNVKKRTVPGVQQQFALFTGLSIAAQILIATIYLLTLGEIDDYTYGRYSELIIPFAMVFGLTALWKMRSKRIWLATGVLAALQMMVTFLVVRQVINTGTNIFYGYFMVGLSYLYRGENFEITRFYMEAYLFGEFLTVFVTGAVLFARRRPKRQYVFVALALLELILAMRVTDIYLGPFKKAAFRDSRLADKIAELQNVDLSDEVFEMKDRNVIYMDGNVRAYIGILQFMARDMDIQVMERRETVNDYNGDITGRDILVFAFDDMFWREWEEQYAHADIYGHFTILYN